MSARKLLRAVLSLISWRLRSCCCAVWPVYLSYRHERLEAERLTMVEKITHLRELLEIPAGFHAFLRFCMSPHDRVSCWSIVLRVRLR